jgi:hypothetical protein
LRSTPEKTKFWPIVALLTLLVICQIALGGSTYVVKYAFPTWLHDFQYAAAYVVQEKSLAQALVTTAHVATGSLILFVATLQATLAAAPFFALASRPAGSVRAWPTIATSLAGSAVA